MAEAKKIPVVEVFGPTIQGEGSMIGRQTMFIRFGLCDYKCKFCDSMHAVDPHEVKARARWMTCEEIAKDVHALAPECRWITFSGGNPCIHDLTVLVEMLHNLGHKISVETQGSKLPGWLEACDEITICPKGPGLGEKFEVDHLGKFFSPAIQHKVSLKFVIFNQQDIEYASLLATMYPDVSLYLSLGNPFPPVFDKETPADIPEYHSDQALRETLFTRYEVLWEDIQQEPSLKDARWLPQLHVLLWGNKQEV